MNRKYILKANDNNKNEADFLLEQMDARTR